MELMTVQIAGIVIASLILANHYWMAFKERREKKIDTLPSQKARCSRRQLRIRR